MVLGIIFFRRLKHASRRDIIGGAIIGAVFTAVMTFELTALKTTDTSTVSFLENTAIVFVPLIEAAIIRRLPKTASIISAAVALCGVGLLTLRGGSFGFTPGELFCLCAAVLYAVGIIVTDRYSHKCDALIVGIVEVGCIGLFSLILSFIFEQPRIPSGGTEWGCVLVLALVCTGFGFTLQPVAQSHTTSRRAAHPRKSVYSASARAFRCAKEKDRINRIIKSTAPHVFREVLCFCILISRARGWGDRCRFREAR